MVPFRVYRRAVRLLLIVCLMWCADMATRWTVFALDAPHAVRLGFRTVTTLLVVAVCVIVGREVVSTYRMFRNRRRMTRL